jgi:predicted alpha/beta-hydrolase family hydrolase
VLFAHGSGSSRHSARNRFVAQTLNNAGLATLLFDLVPGATRLFKESGALESVAKLASEWFRRHLSALPGA